MRWRYAGAAYSVGDWSCRGQPSGGQGSGASATEETLEYCEINLQRSGWHVRSTGRQQFFIDPLHHTLWPGGGGYRLSHNYGRPQAATLLFVKRDFLETALADIPGATGQDWKRLNQRPAVIRCDAVDVVHSRLLSIPAHTPVASEEAALGLLRCLLAAIVPFGAEARTPSAYESAAAHRAQAFLVSHFSEDISLADIARAASLSVSRLSAIFPRVLGITVWRYTQSLRLQAAMHMLRSGADAIELSTLALTLGFSSQSHFTHAFRTRFGRTPAQFRLDRSGQAGS